MSEMMKKAELRNRGWTDTLIKTFLPEPDATSPNPRYVRAGAPMKLYNRSRVEMVESTREFQEAKTKADRRRERARKAVETKHAKMAEFLENLKIEIPLIEKATLIEKARANFISLGLPSEVNISDERMCVNYLRHCRTDYERQLAEIAGKVGSRDAYYELKEDILFEIGFAYDWLSDECDRQRKALRESQDWS